MRDNTDQKLLRIWTLFTQCWILNHFFPQNSLPIQIIIKTIVICILLWFSYYPIFHGEPRIIPSLSVRCMAFYVLTNARMYTRTYEYLSTRTHFVSTLYMPTYTRTCSLFYTVWAYATIWHITKRFSQNWVSFFRFFTWSLE